MLVTRETDYALRIIRALSKGEKKTVDDISRDEQISRQFSYKILKKLQKSGLVRIIRGAGGGYVLAADVGGITLYDVIATIEGELLLNGCLEHGFYCPMRGRGKKICGVHRELSRIQKVFSGYLKEKTLAEIF